MLKVRLDNKLAEDLRDNKLSGAALKLLFVLMYQTRRGNILEPITRDKMATRAALSPKATSEALHELAESRYIAIYNEGEGRQIMLSPWVAFSGTTNDEVQAREDFDKRAEAYFDSRIDKIKRAAARKKAAAQAAAATATAKAKATGTDSQNKPAP